MLLSSLHRIMRLGAVPPKPERGHKQEHRFPRDVPSHILPFPTPQVFPCNLGVVSISSKWRLGRKPSLGDSSTPQAHASPLRNLMPILLETAVSATRLANIA